MHIESPRFGNNGHVDDRLRLAWGAGALSAVTCGAGVGWLQHRAVTDRWSDGSTHDGVSLLIGGLLIFVAPMMVVTFVVVRRTPLALGWAGLVNMLVAGWVAFVRLTDLVGMAFPMASAIGCMALIGGSLLARWYGRRLRQHHL